MGFLPKRGTTENAEGTESSVLRSSPAFMAHHFFLASEERRRRYAVHASCFSGMNGNSLPNEVLFNHGLSSQGAQILAEGVAEGQVRSEF
jgi:hypothetical protein